MRPAKAIWLRLEVTHEGTTEVKDSRIRMLTQLFENFKMLENEKLDTLFSRFAAIVNPLKSLGKKLTEQEQVTKLLYALKGNTWIQKRQIIEATQNLKTMTFEALMGNLKAHEVQQSLDFEVPKIDSLKLEVKKPKEERNMAFSSSKHVHHEEYDSSDDEVDVALSYLVKAMKKKKNRKYGKNSKEKYVPRCYECNEKGHLRSDCPKLEKEKKKDAEDPNRGKGKYKRSEKKI